jgi:hypothetical protein
MVRILTYTKKPSAQASLCKKKYLMLQNTDMQSVGINDSNLLTSSKGNSIC